nr:MAG TPA: hypothetical protein [Caudoviricetes sp.]
MKGGGAIALTKNNSSIPTIKKIKLTTIYERGKLK